MNAGINGFFIITIGTHYSLHWIYDIRFVVGLAVFVVGFVINQSSDHTLRQLRKPSETGYKIPQKGFFHYVSSPNYLGEIIEWVGWAILTWSLAGLAFALFTIANLAPRARATHNWYKKTFSAYPKSRKALIPFIW